MSALDDLIAGHSALCTRDEDRLARCNCGSDEARADLAALRARVATLEAALADVHAAWHAGPSHDSAYEAISRVRRLLAEKVKP